VRLVARTLSPNGQLRIGERDEAPLEAPGRPVRGGGCGRGPVEYPGVDGVEQDDMTHAKKIGFLSFGAWHPGGGLTRSAGVRSRRASPPG
jgi:hypothetical protein